MIKRLFTHNWNHYLFRLLFLTPLITLFLVQNYELMSILNTYGTTWLLPASQTYSHYQVLGNLSDDSMVYYSLLNAENLSDLYRKIKNEFDIVVQYSSYSSNEELLVLDADYYRSEFDRSFSGTTFPCVLEAPQGYKGKEGSRLGPKCGTNSTLAQKYENNMMIDFNRTSAVLIDGYLEPKTQGNEMVLYPNRDTLDILISNAYTYDQQREIIENIQQTYEDFYTSLGLKGSAIVINRTMPAQSMIQLLKDAWHFSTGTSIPIILLAFAGIFVLVNLLVQTNRNYIVICTLVSKKKWRIYSPLYLSCLLFDLIAIIISICLFTPLTDIPVKEAPFIAMVLTIALVLIETIIFLIMSRIYRGNKLAMDIRAKESD